MRTRGFTLIEIMIVVAIIAILAAIAIPNLIEARKRANEQSAVGYLRAIHSAQTMYRERDIDGNGVHEYSRMSGPLSPLLAWEEGLDAPHSGYMFGIIDDPSEDARFTWFGIAAPVSFGRSGDYAYCINETGMIRYATSGVVTLYTDVEPTYAELRLWTPVGQ